MMKKLLLLSSALIAFHFGTKAQVGVSTPTVVTDTLRYFLNKQTFKLGSSLTNSTTPFSYFIAPTGNATNSYTYVTHFGSIFHNSDPNLVISGLEGYAAKHNKAISGIIPVKIYLYNVVNGIPTTVIDSISGSVGNPCNAANYCPPQLIAGSFTHAVNNNVVTTPHTVAGDFAVLFRNYSSVSGDTVRFFRTSTLTQNNVTASGPGAQFYKTGENLGLVRKSGTWYTTANYTGVSGFGYGTDYEALVAPRVQFTLTVSQNVPTNAMGDACAFDQLTYTNTSSPEFTNRQFNMNEFYRQLKPFQAGPTANGFMPDTVMRWNFDDDPRLDTVPYLWGRVQDLFLGANQTTVSKWFDTTGVFLHGKQIATYRYMSMNATANQAEISGQETFSTSVILCGADGIKELKGLNNVVAYPNPAVNGKLTVANLQGNNTIYVYNMIGQLVLTEAADKETATVDLSKQPTGTYMVRVVNADNRSKVIKVINGN